MQLNKVRVSVKADNYLRQMKARTGLTANLLSRIGFCLSLQDPTIPDPNAYDDESIREFNRYTLTGQWDILFVALLRQRCYQDGLRIPEDLDEQFRAHLNRGIILLFQRMKYISDLSRLVEEVHR